MILCLKKTNEWEKQLCNLPLTQTLQFSAVAYLMLMFYCQKSPQTGQTYIWSSAPLLAANIYVFNSNQKIAIFYQLPASTLSVTLVILLLTSLKITPAFLNVFGNLATVVKCLLLSLPISLSWVSPSSFVVYVFLRSKAEN